MGKSQFLIKGRPFEISVKDVLETSRWSSTACAASVRYFGFYREDNLRAVDSFSTIDLIYLHLVFPLDSFYLFFFFLYLYIYMYLYIRAHSISGIWHLAGKLDGYHRYTHTHTHRERERERERQALVFVLSEIFFSLFLSFVNFISSGVSFLFVNQSNGIDLLQPLVILMTCNGQLQHTRSRDLSHRIDRQENYRMGKAPNYLNQFIGGHRSHAILFSRM